MATREFKFRAWDDIEKEWLCIKHLGIMNNAVWYTQAIDENENDIDPPYFVDDKKVRLMQYTGLKDKNGVEIYEGDILDYRKDTNRTLMFEVVFNHASFCRRWISKDTAKIRGLEIETLAYNTSTIFEVIGNRFENPELIEVKN